MSSISWGDRREPPRSRRPRVERPDHLDFIRSLPCLACRFGPESNLDGASMGVEAAHIRYADLRFAKRETGKGEKPDDKWAVPLCARHHRTGPQAQHSMDEEAFWRLQNIDATRVAAGLFLNSGDHNAGLIVIMAAQTKAPHLL